MTCTFWASSIVGLQPALSGTEEALRGIDRALENQFSKVKIFLGYFSGETALDIAFCSSVRPKTQKQSLFL